MFINYLQLLYRKLIGNFTLPRVPNLLKMVEVQVTCRYFTLLSQETLSTYKHPMLNESWVGNVSEEVFKKYIILTIKKFLK